MEPAQEEVPTQSGVPTVQSSNSTPQRPKPSRAPPVQSSNSTPHRPEPSREIRNIIRMYQSRPGPVPVPVQPTRYPWDTWPELSLSSGIALCTNLLSLPRGPLKLFRRKTTLRMRPWLS